MMGLPTCPPNGHDFAFLREVITHHPDVWENGWPRSYAHKTHDADRFYCRRCLVYVDRHPSKAPRDLDALDIKTEASS